MKTIQSLRVDLDHIQSKHRFVEDKERRKLEKESKKYQEFIRILELPNAEEVLRRDLERLEDEVKLVDSRWERTYGKNGWKTYQIHGNPNANEKQRKNHHHA